MPIFDCALSRFGRRIKKYAFRGRCKTAAKSKHSDLPPRPSAALFDTPEHSPASSLTPSLESDASLPASPPSLCPSNASCPPSPFPSCPPSPAPPCPPSPFPSCPPSPAPPCPPSPSPSSPCRCRKGSDCSIFTEPESGNCPLFDIIGFYPATGISCQENTNLPILLLILVVTCRQPAYLRFAARLKNSEDSLMARAGFIRHDEASAIVCAFCGEEAAAPEPSFAACMALHSGACAYRDLWVMLQSHKHQDKIRTDLLPLLRHLKTELSSTKVIVAKELRFSADQIVMELAHRFLTTVSPFPDAGALIDVLSERWDFTEELDRWILLDGVSDFLLSLDATPAPVQVQRLLRTPSVRPQARPPMRTLSGRERLLRETRVLLKMSKCRVCGEEEANQLCLPCSHLTLCSSCAPRVTHCPKCQSLVETVMRTYHA